MAGSSRSAATANCSPGMDAMPACTGGRWEWEAANERPRASLGSCPRGACRREGAGGTHHPRRRDGLPAGGAGDRGAAGIAHRTAHGSLLADGVVIAILWLVIGRVDIVASAGGKIIPADAVKLVQPPETGVVR